MFTQKNYVVYDQEVFLETGIPTRIYGIRDKSLSYNGNERSDFFNRKSNDLSEIDEKTRILTSFRKIAEKNT